MTAPAFSSTRALAEQFLRSHPVEVAHVVELWDTPTLLEMFKRQPVEQGAALLEHLVPDAAARMAAGLDDGAVGWTLARMDPARAAAILAHLDAGRHDVVLSVFPPHLAGEVRDLLSYPAGSAGSLMDARVLTFRLDAPAGQVLSRVRQGQTRQTGGIVVVDADGRLAGMVNIGDVALADPEAPLASLVPGSVARVPAVAPREDVVEELSRLKATSLPVVDAEERVIGIIRHDALVQAVREEASVDMQKMVGASAEERALSSVSFAVRKRLPWLQVNLLTAFLAASIVGIFENTIAQFTALAVLLPVVAGQSGNTGAQALAVTMRGLALREIRLRHWWQMAVKEATVGFVNGIGVALTTSIAVFAWSRSLGLATVIGTSMVLSMSCAGLAGATVPLALVALKQDPAQSSSIVLTTVTDIVGFFSFLGLATLLSSTL